MKKLLLSALMLTLALPAFAFDIPMPDGMKLNMYGQVRMAAFYQGINQSNGNVNNTSGDYRMQWQGNSRLGFNFSVGNFFSTMELNVQPDQLGSVGFREFYGGYNFENGITFLAGNKTTIAGNDGVFGDVYFGDNNLSGFGAIDDTRRPMVMLGYAGFNLALVTNEGDANTVSTNIIDPETGARRTTTKGEYYMPRFELAYNLKINNITGKIAAAYGLFAENMPDNGEYQSINAFHVAFNVKPQFGNFYFAVGAFYSMNGGMYNAVKMLNNAGTNVDSLRPTITRDVDGKASINDVSTWGVALALGYKISDMFSAELGGGYQDSTSDGFLSANNEKENIAGYAVYLNAPVRFNQYFMLVPQIGYYGRSTDAVINGVTSVETLMAGAQLRVLF